MKFDVNYVGKVQSQIAFFSAILRQPFWRERVPLVDIINAKISKGELYGVGDLGKNN